MTTKLIKGFDPSIFGKLISIEQDEADPHKTIIVLDRRNPMNEDIYMQFKKAFINKNVAIEFAYLPNYLAFKKLIEEEE